MTIKRFKKFPLTQTTEITQFSDPALTTASFYNLHTKELEHDIFKIYYDNFVFKRRHSDRRAIHEKHPNMEFFWSKVIFTTIFIQFE